MTEQAGSSNKPVENTGPPPWERKWNDVKEFVGKTVDAAVDTTQKALNGVKMPWERQWGGEVAKPQQTFAMPPVAPVGALKTEAAMVKAAQFSPAELKQHAKEMRSPENIAELQREIKRTTNPSAKKILVDTLEKLQGS